MRFAILAAACCLAGTAAAATKAPPEPSVYIFDLLPLQPYKGTLAHLLVGKRLPDWVEAISTRGEGTAVPAKTLDIGGTAYRLDRVCKPHDCAGNTLEVLWAPAGHKAWATLVDGGKPPAMLGDPPPPQAKALADALSPGDAQAAAAEASPPAAAPATPAATPPAPSPPAAAQAAAAAPAPNTYIFDLLALQPYRGNFARLVKAKGLPAWIADIVVKGEGSAGPGRTVAVDGTPYRLDRVCKPHDCAGNTLDVLWAPGGRRVWAALVDGGKPPVMLGKPPAAEEKALRDATTGAAAAPASGEAPRPSAQTAPVNPQN